jgi:hypothetical protein
MIPAKSFTKAADVGRISLAEAAAQGVIVHSACGPDAAEMGEASGRRISPGAACARDGFEKRRCFGAFLALATFEIQVMPAAQGFLATGS